MMTMLLAIPNKADARIVRGYPEFGQNEFNQILGDFMLNSKLNLGKYYTIESVSTNKNGLKTYTIEKGDTYLAVTTDSNDIIKGLASTITFTPDSGLTAGGMYNIFGQVVKWRYGNPDSEEMVPMKLDTTAKLNVDGAYKYTYKGFSYPGAGKNGEFRFIVNIEAL